MQDTVAILERLVAHDTTSRNSNLELIDWVADYLADNGVASTRLPDATGMKASLVARIGPEQPGGVVLCGHTDVVPVDGQPWTYDPFKLTREGERLYGRGTTDMKGFIASVLAAVPHLTETDLVRPVTLAFTYDEEVGCLGAPALAQHLAAEQPRPAVVVVGEPTSMRVVRKHKGVRVLRTTITGRDAHSSRTDLGASAIMAAASMVSRIEMLAGWLAARGVRADGFVPPHTTMNVGTIAGGQALNIVPRTCTFVWEYRWVPGEDVDAIQQDVEDFAQRHVLPNLRRTAPDASIVTEVLADVPALESPSSEENAALLQAWDLAESEQAVAYATDGSTLERAGLPTIVCGPGSMDQGHQPDEYIEMSELDRCDAFLQDVTKWCCSS